MSRTKFCFWGCAEGAVGDLGDDGMSRGFKVGTLAVANFDVFLLKRLTLTTWAVAAQALGTCDSKDCGGVGSLFENTVNWMQRKRNFVNICAEGQGPE